MITICRADELEEFLAGGQYDAVLSIEHPGAKLGEGAAPRIDSHVQKILTFWDIEDEQANQGPSEDVVEQAMKFLDDHRGENVIVHCNAGKSRSVAIALGWMAKDMARTLPRDEAIEYAIEYIKGARSMAAPNKAVIDIIDRLYDFDGELSDKVEKDPLFSKNRDILADTRRHIALTRPDIISILYPEKQPDDIGSGPSDPRSDGHDSKPPNPS